MTSILLVPFHPPGHAEPMAALAGQLRAAGHEVTTFSEETASRWCPDAPIPPHLYSADSATLFRHIFLGDLEAMVRDIVDLAYDCGAELIVADVMAAGGALAAQRIDLPWVSLSFSPVPALDSYRTFLPPHAVDSFAPHRVLAALGLPDDDVSLLGRTSPQLHLIPTTPRFAGAHRLPDEVALVGPFTEVPTPRTRPGGRPVVVVSASTNAPINLGVRALVQDRYVAAAVQALAGLPVDGLVTHGGAGLAPTGPIPDNVRLLGRTPHDELFDRASAVVTHAGWGTVCRALVRGLPLVLVPIFADQPYIATRCAELGLGIALDADTVTATELRDAIRAVVEEPRYRNAAQEVAGELRAMAPLATAADLITASLQPSEG
ncbi:glycosyltransferase [Catellatospora bangladeshensis]|uniref:Erythromycin biosynthesis protein CIII-like C-terminal domain-containing protein n=1 Tax=Catellatospora bangladeshensis TaxID=310355 RepID=A0A8J3JNP2_9ACTN|nr:glycosyltransferase [Catellatospora bangladeshensis]GIF80469.1 hypothetical protein Cba03nite_18180 [Catellatospora bangladeshensis]